MAFGGDSAGRARMEKVPWEIVVSPRAVERIEAARGWLRGLPCDAEALVVAPSREAADDLVRSIAAGGRTLFGLHRLTLNRLAGLLGEERLRADGLAPAGALAVEAIAARAVGRLSETGALAHFTPVIEMPGFPRALASTLAELRLNRIAPDAVAQSGAIGQALAAALSEFEHELRRAQLADRAAVLAAAIDALEGTPPPRFSGLPTLMLDVAVETALERDFVARLCARAPRFFATVPAGDSTSETMLREALGVGAERITRVVSEPESSLGRLQTHLFAETAPQEAALDETVALVSAPGEMHECVEIARRIQAEARSGVPFDRIAVLCHAGDRYGPYLEEALGRAGIEAYFATGTRRPEPGGRALLAMLSCAAEDLSASRFAEYLSLAQVPEPGRAAPADGFVPPATELFGAALASDLEPDPEIPETQPPDTDPVPVVDGTVRAPWRWERLMVDAAVIGSRERWERRLAGLEAELKRKCAELEPDEEHRARAFERDLLDLAHLKTIALPIIDRLAAHPRAAPWSEWLTWLRSLVELAIRDAEPVLAALAELEPMGPVGPVRLDEVRSVLAERLGRLERPPARRRYGAVFVAPPGHARGMAFDVVIVPGLAERMFPKKLTEDPLLADRLRAAISPMLKRQEERVAAERLALRLTAGAATKRAMFTYARVDLDQGRPRVPSFYALELLRAAEGRLPGFDELARRASCEQATRLGWPAPRTPEEAIDDAEFDLAVLDRLLDRNPDTTIGAAHYLLGANEHLARALRARARRWLRRWTAADGLVDPEPAAVAALARHQMGARSYSPTALQNFAACPYRFLLQAIFRLEPREDAEAIEVIDPLTRGSLTHEMQYELLVMLRERRALPVTDGNLEQAFGELDRIVEQVARRWHDELCPAIERVWNDGIDGIRADLREWLRRAAEEREGWCPERFELAFGLAEREQADPASTPESVDLDGGLKLRGSIDLVERNCGGVLRVTDHKTGRVRAARDFVIGGGKILQPVLYALAAEQVLGAKVESGRLYYCTAAGGYEERVVAMNDAARAGYHAFLRTFDEALKAAFLPAAPAANECRWCDYRRVCGPYEERRVEIKPPARLAPLRKLREMR